MSIISISFILLGCMWRVNGGGIKLRIFVVDSLINKTVDSCYALPANFGPTQLLDRFPAVPVSADPINGCADMRQPPYRRNDSARWAALINRDPPGRAACYFDTKAINANAAGFGIAIIVNYEDDISEMDASDRGSRVLIPVAMVTESCGYLLRQYARKGDRFHLTFWLTYPLDFRAYVIPFIAIVSVCFIFFTALWVVKWYRDWKRRQKNRLSRSSLKKLRQKKFDEASDPFECCAICLEDYAQGDKLRILPCNHAYHQVCIDPWLLKNRSVCPVCKRRVFPRDASESDSEADTGTDERTPLLAGGVGSGESGRGTFDSAGPSASSSSSQSLSVHASVHIQHTDSPSPLDLPHPEQQTERGTNRLV